MKINILQGAFLPVPPSKGGAIEAAWYSLGRNFVSKGHQVTHYSCMDKGLPETQTDGGVKYIRIQGATSVTNPYLLKVLELPYVLRARKVMTSADILVTHAFWAPILFPKANYGKLYVHVGRYPKGQLRLYKKASRFQVPSKSIEDVSKEQVPAQAYKVKTLPYPLTWHPSPKENLNHKEKVLLYAGRIHPEKGIESLLQAWGKLSNEVTRGWTLRIIGPWKEEQGGGGQKFRDGLVKITKSSQNQFEFLEPVFDRNVLKKEMEKAIFFLYPSEAKDGETFGLAVLEAMSCGCIPIVSDLPCFADFISFEEEGFCLKQGINMNMEEAISEALPKILALNESQTRKLGLSAWNRSKEYELDKIARDYLDDFDSLLQK
jgi:glycosyltransferase involved in cell wall biosynthesis